MRLKSGHIPVLVMTGGTLILAWLATSLGILLAHAFHTKLFVDPILWMDRHSGVAAWVQGVGSVLAILATAAVAGWQMRTSQQDNRSARRRTYRTKICAVDIIFGHAMHVVAMSKQDLEALKKIQPIPLEELSRVCKLIETLPMFDFPDPAALDHLNIVSRDLRLISFENASIDAADQTQIDLVKRHVDNLELKLKKFRGMLEEMLIRATIPGEAVPIRLKEKFNSFHGIQG